jgi:hypothetical protein
MGQLLSINCCEGADFEITKCACSCWPRRSSPNNLVYLDGTRSISIVNVPHVDIPSLLPDTIDVKDTDRILFAGRGVGAAGEIYLVGTQGLNMWRGESEVKTEHDMEGKSIDSIWPVHIVRFLKPIFQNTLAGGFYQLHVFWKNSVQLIRTFPLYDQKQRIVGGVCVISPTAQADINQFEVRPTNMPWSPKDSEPAAHSPTD